VEEDQEVLVDVVPLDMYQVDQVHTVLKHCLQTKEISHQDHHNILFVLQHQLDVHVVDVVLVEVVVDSVVAQHMFKVQV
tara:strand:- start:323 stop:559 length:237 start_codon:yes stop_codon:yes gene_type:complete